MRKLFYCSLLFSLIFCSNLRSQVLNCTQSLRTARSTYDQGRLHEVSQFLTGVCLNGNEADGEFTDAERIEAYRMLTLTYIYLEEPELADREMINLLETEHFFELNEEVDPIEFKNLYKKFRTDPVYRVGLKAGINTNFINVLENHYIWSESQGKGTYSSKIGIQTGLLFEKDLKYLNKRLVFNPELFYSSYSFIYKNPSLLDADSSQNPGIAEHTISQSRIQANLMLQFKFDKTYILADKFIPYVAFGPSVSYLLNSSFDGNTNADEQVTGPSVTTKSNYNPIAFSLMAAAGIKLRVGGFYITADVRYQYGLQNVVNKNNRFRWDSDNEDLLDYGYVDNDYTISQAMFNVGLILPHFHPKKLIK